MIRACTILLLLSSLTADGQPSERFAWSYAAPHAPRIGASSEPAEDRVRLDIGGSVRLAEPSGATELGVDVFTWSRLRSEANFKFPVEAIDYYFGLYGGWEFAPEEPISLVATLRLGHISAHLVDGEERFGQTGFRPVVYSREFLDLEVGGLRRFGSDSSGGADLRGYLRGSIGGRWLFHTIPDTIGRIRPDIALESALQPSADLPLTLRVGVEFGLNTEFDPLLESSLRSGLKFAGVEDVGVMLEGGYYRGRSLYGQFLAAPESYFWIGFGVGR